MNNKKIHFNCILKKLNIFYLLIIFQLFLILIFLFIIYLFKNNEMLNKNHNEIIYNEFNNSNIVKQIELDFENNIFAIVKVRCKTCGLFSFYNHYLGCIHSFIKNGYIPIIDLTFKNIFNRDEINSLNKNPWELYFNQPYQYSLETVKKQAKNIKYFVCPIKIKEIPNKYTIYINKILMDFWHNIAIKYVPINNEIIKEANLMRKYLFKNSNNILGVLVRGTDYITAKPKNHAIQPNITTIFKDIKNFHNKNNYDWIFITTEDDIIRKKFIFEFKKKLKYIKSKNINYNYSNKKFLIYNKQIKFDYNYFKTYIINVIIISKCIDIICGRNNGSIAAFIFSNGFRNNKVYYLGQYK